MKRLIPGTVDVYISETCEFYYQDDTKREDIFVDENNKATLEICGRMQTIDTHFLMLLAFFEIPTYVNLDNVQFIKVNIKKKHFPYRAIFKKPIYYGSKKELRIIPSFSQTAVTADGRIYSLVKHRWLPQYTGATGYNYVPIYDPLTQVWRGVGVHQLVAMAWISKDQDGLHTVINHRNGIRSDNRVSNLEWCTQKHNVHDGVARNKSNSEVLVRLRDVFTKEIHEFRSYSDVGRFLKSPSIHEKSALIPRRRNKLYQNRYEVRLAGDNRPWFFEDENIVNYSTSKYTIVVIEDTGRRLLFNGCKAFTDFYGFGLGHLGIDELVEMFKKKFPASEIFYTNLSEAVPIEVLEESTGRVTRYDSKIDVCKSLKLTYQLVTILATSGGSILQHGYRMRIASDSTAPWPKIYEVKDPKERPIIRVTHRLSGETHDYLSLDKVSEKLNLSRPAVRRMIVSPNQSDEYKVEYYTPQLSSTKGVESSHELLETPKDQSTTK